MTRRFAMLAAGFALVACGGTTGDGVDAPDRDVVDAADDSAPDVQPEVQPDVEPDAEPDVEPDVESEADAEPDAPPDTVPDEAGETVGDAAGTVACGPTLTCTPPGERCCVQNVETDPTFSCIPAADACPDGVTAACDGPEDCAEVCCLTVTLEGGRPASATTECTARTDCVGLTSVAVCRTLADCPSGARVCCPAPPASGISSGYCWSLGTRCPY